MKRSSLSAVALVVALATTASSARPQRSAPPSPRNVILFVADGLRGGIVDPTSAPSMAKLRSEGTSFPNSHSVFPTFTTANASVLATGHQLGDTGDFSNVIYTGQPLASANGSRTPFLESNPVLGEIDARFGGDFLNETTILEAARRAGYGTAAIGKLGPVLIQDHRARDGGTFVIDDATGSPGGIPLAPALAASLRAAGLPTIAPGRGDNGRPGSATSPGTTVSNKTQQDYLTAAATEAVLPLLKAKGRPFVLVFWSRDPDGTQHNQGDSLNRLTPGINGPSSLDAIRNADDDLGRLRAALTRLGLAQSTNIIVTSDHGFSTISKQSSTSAAARAHYDDVPAGMLPPGFLAIDLAASLGLPIFDPDASDGPISPGKHPSRGNALFGADPAQPRIVVAANGGSDLIYLVEKDRTLARQIITHLLAQDYVDGLFVDDQLGSIGGTLPLSAINLAGAAVTPRPSIVVNFKSWSGACAVRTNCQIEIADTVLQQGQGMHGSFGRGDTFNFTAAVGPDFKRGFVDPAPVSNVDIGRTLASLLRLRLADHGRLLGRSLVEAMPGGSTPRFTQHRLVSARGADGSRTVLTYQVAAGVRYLDAGRREFDRARARR